MIVILKSFFDTIVEFLPLDFVVYPVIALLALAALMVIIYVIKGRG